ncbi:MAG: homoserine O-acetyltransferase [Gammaproteobacteria bacterium]|nr:homoserine O-acetyltransferase [Gammaproteobacteria bacterium]
MTTQLAHIDRLSLESGQVLHHVPVAYRTWGELNAAADNVIVICHALTGNTDADDWWSGLIGPGKAIDTHHYFVVCANVIGSPYGSVSPLTVNPQTGQAWGPDFPTTTVRDCVALHRQLLEQLGVARVAFAIGGSLGGMQALEWAFHGDFVRGLVPIAVGGRHSAWCIGWSEAQRRAIVSDSRWRDGLYDVNDPPVDGLAVARMMAMISYRSFEEFDERFGREQSDDGFHAETYLRHQGQKLVDRFDANCYLRLTEVMDTHDVSRDRGHYLDVLRGIEQPTLVVGITTDILYPLEEQRELEVNIPNAELAVLKANQGHDSFLIAQEQLDAQVRRWREANIDPLVS